MIRFLIVMPIFIILTGCSKPAQDVDEYIAGVKKNAKQNVEPLAPAVAYESVDYSVAALRSPFSHGSASNLPKQAHVSILPEGVSQKPRPDANRTREYLERYSLGSFLMVGTLSKRGSRWGLVQDSSGMVHAVRVGDYIGENSGHVTRIQDDQIDVINMVPNGEGGWMEMKTHITMKQELE